MRTPRHTCHSSHAFTEVFPNHPSQSRACSQLLECAHHIPTLCIRANPVRAPTFRSTHTVFLLLEFELIPCALPAPVFRHASGKTSRAYSHSLYRASRTISQSRTNHQFLYQASRTIFNPAQSLIPYNPPIPVSSIPHNLESRTNHQSLFKRPAQSLIPYNPPIPVFRYLYRKSSRTCSHFLKCAHSLAP